MGICAVLRIALDGKLKKNEHSVVLLRKLIILLSLAIIPAWTIYYVHSVMTFVIIYSDPPDFAGFPPAPVPFYIMGLAWLVFDVLWQFRKLQHEIIRGPVIDGTPESLVAPANSSSPGNQNKNKYLFTKNKLYTCGGRVDSNR